MFFEKTEIDGLWAIAVERHTDVRGSFARTFCRREFAARGLVHDFVQGSASVTRLAGTLRGMHLQLAPHAEVKLVRCVRGAVYDVVADARTGSPTHGRWQAFTLDHQSGVSLYIPAGCLHGFLTLCDDVELLYEMSVEYAPQAAAGMRYDDPAFGIAWPRTPALIIEKDLAWPPYGPTNVP